jgi:hypothetical protein
MHAIDSSLLLAILLFFSLSLVAGVVRNKRSLGSTEVHEFIANHPFVFFVRERRTDLMLFVGRVVKPSGVGVHHDEL